MRIGGTGGAFALGLMVSACAIVSPLVDRQMAGAPNAACAAVNVQAEAEAPQCFVLLEEGADGMRRNWSGGAVSPGRSLVAIHQPSVPGCGGRFSHVTVTGASASAGQAELSVWDPLGRPGHGRTLRWSEPFAGRTFALASIDSVVLLPVGARMQVTQGSFEPASLCFKSY